VIEMADTQWRKRRLRVGSQLAFCRDQDAGALVEAGKKGWNGIVEHLGGSWAPRTGCVTKFVARQNLLSQLIVTYAR